MFGQKSFGFTDLTKSILNEDWKLALMLCQAYPRQAGVWSNRRGFFDGRHDSRILPLHLACALYPPLDIIQALVLACPRGVKSRETAYERLPVHVACRNSANPEVIEALLTYFPEGARTPDKLGRLPLHYASCNGTSYDVVDTLLDTFPEAVHAADHRGWLPIHVACCSGAPLSIIRRLLEECPGTISVKTKQGNTPLTCAKMIANQSSDEVKSFLMSEMTRYRRRKAPTCDDTQHSADGKCIVSMPVPV